MKILSVTVLVLLLSSMARAQNDPSFLPIKDDPKLPRVLLIGDSISMGYTIPVRKLLEGKANVHRILENGGPTSNGVARIEQWLGKEKWDVIHFNFGLHDLKLDKDGKHQVPLADYEKNLRLIVTALKKSGAKLIWASTTPIPDGKLSPMRKPGDEVRYNESARKVMEENLVAINGLHAFAAPKLKDLQIAANVHFTEKGSAELATQVARVIEAALPPKK